jgi:hypothetical protein
VSSPSTAREALLAELIGDVAQLIKRMETLPPAMDKSRQALLHASAQLASQIVAFDKHMAATAENAKTQALRHIAERTNELTLRLREEQTQAMAATARELFKTELGPAMQRLASPLQNLVKRLDRPWEGWLTHAATAAVAAASTWALAVFRVFA